MNTLDHELIDTKYTLNEFNEKYQSLLYNNMIFFENYHKNTVYYLAYLKFNHKVIFEYTLNENDSISKQKEIETLNDFNIIAKIYKLPDNYKQIKEAHFIRELSQLKEKFNLPLRLNMI